MKIKDLDINNIGSIIMDLSPNASVNPDRPKRIYFKRPPLFYNKKIRWINYWTGVSASFKDNSAFVQPAAINEVSFFPGVVSPSALFASWKILSLTLVDVQQNVFVDNVPLSFFAWNFTNRNIDEFNPRVVDWEKSYIFSNIDYNGAGNNDLLTFSVGYDN